MFHVKHLLMATLGVLALTVAACGGGEKESQPADEPTAKPAATAEAEPTKRADPTQAAEPTKETSTRGTEGVSSLFSSVFSTGLSGGGEAAGLGGGDESLKAFLPAEEDFPEGYMPAGSFTFSAPAGSSELGAMDMAMTMAIGGDLAALSGATDPSDVDLSSLDMLMAMVMRPEDLQALGEVFAEIEGLDEEAIQEEINAGLEGMEGMEVTRFEVLDTSGLGEGGFGMEMTVDMSGFASMLGALGGGPGMPELESMTIRMYMFGRGDYIGAVLRMGFTDGLPGDGVDEALAAIVDGKLGG